MIDKSTADEIYDRVCQLSPEQQKQVLAYVRQIEHPVRISGAELIKRLSELNFNSDDLEALEQMRRAIEEERECVRNEIPWLRNNK